MSSKSGLTEQQQAWDEVMDGIRDLQARKIGDAIGDFEVSVQPATQIVLRENIEFLNELCNKSKKTDEHHDNLARHIIGNRHPEYQPLVGKLLQVTELPRNRKNALALSLLESNADFRAKTDIAIGALLQQDPEVVSPFFRYWFGRTDENWHQADVSPLILRRTDFAKLEAAPSPWVRMLLYRSAPNELSSAAVEQLLRDLRKIRQPIARRDINGLVRDLDSESFRTREFATARLVEFREPIIPTLRAILNEHLSAEVQNRLETAIGRIEKLPPTDFEREIFHQHLQPIRWDQLYPAHCELILEALADNIPESWISKESRKLLKVLKEAKMLSDRPSKR
jgi:hypothetical protein